MTGRLIAAVSPIQVTPSGGLSDTGRNSILAGPLLELREALGRENGDVRAQIVGELLIGLRDSDQLATAQTVELLAAIAGADDDRRAALADVVGTIARRLAPDDEPPAGRACQAAWRVLVGIADRLYGSRVAAMGRLPFISARLVELMTLEARARLRERPESGRRVSAEGGRALASLAVSRRLEDAVGAALGYAVVPGYRALYAYDPPGSHVQSHVDARDYELIFHMVLEHDLPTDGSPGSALVAHLPGHINPARVWLRPGEGVALCGRGTIHSWQELREDERRTLVDVGFSRA